MEKLTCKACGSASLVPMDVIVTDDEIKISDVQPHGQESRYFTCRVCGDNFLSLREDYDGHTSITFIHQMGQEPELRRIGHLEDADELEGAVLWEYYVGEEMVTESEWVDELRQRRSVLRSVCTN